MRARVLARPRARAHASFGARGDGRRDAKRNDKDAKKRSMAKQTRGKTEPSPVDAELTYDETQKMYFDDADRRHPAPWGRSDDLRLILLRHGKSDWSDGTLTDKERPLKGRGRKRAKLAGEFIRNMGWRPDLVITSDAMRCLETVECIDVSVDARVVYSTELYYVCHGDDVSGERSAEVIGRKVMREVDKDDPERTVMCVGHNFGFELAARVLGTGTEDLTLKTAHAALLTANGRGGRVLTYQVQGVRTEEGDMTRHCPVWKTQIGAASVIFGSHDDCLMRVTMRVEDVPVVDDAWREAFRHPGGFRLHRVLDPDYASKTCTIEGKERLLSAHTMDLEYNVRTVIEMLEMEIYITGHIIHITGIRDDAPVIILQGLVEQLCRETGSYHM